MQTSYLQCIKIKDGLYIGNFQAGQDYEFLMTNKFQYIVNCSIQIPNYYQEEGNIKYIKFKLSKNKHHKLWQDDNLKKLNKLVAFIEQSQQSSSCCLIHSQNGNNRSLVMVIAYLMTKFLWKLAKCLEYIKNKNIFIGLSDHNIQQLYLLENILSNKSQLTTQWRIKYRSEQEQIMSKTFLNSKLHEIQSYRLKEGVKKQTKKRVIWLDRLTKTKNNQTNAQKIDTQNKRNDKVNKNNSLTKEKPTSLTKQTKILCKPQINKKSLINQQRQSQQQQQKYEEQIFKFIKKNLKIKKNQLSNSRNQLNSNDNIYSLTINNYIQPNINIINNVKNIENEKKKSLKKQRPWSGNAKNQYDLQQKRTERAITQKNVVRVVSGSTKGIKSQKIVKSKKKDLIKDAKQIKEYKQVNKPNMVDKNSK